MRRGTPETEDLLSIGEVARMKGVGVKALRYYERVGVLPPTFVDPSSGYRYYSMGQMPMVDVIIACVDLGIPLAQIKGHLRPDGSLDSEELFANGLVAARARVRSARLALASLESCEAYTRREASSRDMVGSYPYALEDAEVVVAPWHDEGFDARHYAEAITLLTQVARDDGLAPLARQGFLAGSMLEPCGLSIRTPWSVVLEVLSPSEGEGATPTELDADSGVSHLMFPGKTYEAHRIRETTLATCFVHAFEEKDADVILESWGFDSTGNDGCCEVLRTRS